MAWPLSINIIVIDWLDPPLVEVVICCIIVNWGLEGHYMNVCILLYYYTHMRLYVKFYVKLYVKEWCEWVLCEAICEEMMWMSFMWSYMWRYDVNEFYVILWWSYVKWIALWVKVWFLMMYIWNDVGLWSILKWKCCDLVGRLKCPSLLLKVLNAWMCEMGKTKKWCPFYKC